MDDTEAIPQLKALMQQVDEGDRLRVLRWAWDKYAGGAAQPGATVPEVATKMNASKAANTQSAKKAGKSKSTVSAVKDLNVFPKDKPTLPNYEAAKNASTSVERCLVAIYYMKEVLNVPAVTSDHVYTCFKAMDWKLPYNIPNKLAVIASKYMWLDTSNMQDIRILPKGENEVTQNLMKKAQGHAKSAKNP